MKVAVIGKGTSSIITSMALITNGHEVDVFYDPDKPHISVGESTVIQLGESIRKCLGIPITSLVESGIVSLKTGINFINWGSNDSFIHGFVNDQSAFHFETTKFNPFMQTALEKRGVNYIGKKVENLTFDQSGALLDGKRYDFVVNCSGWSNDVEYREPFFETVNSAILHSKDKIIQHNKTLHEATEDGWQFGLPFPNMGITKHGYLFNDKISSVDEVKEKFKDIDYRLIQWKPKFSKELLHNPFYASNGNRLFFTEPLQALSLAYYDQFAQVICKYLSIENRDFTLIADTNNRYNIDMFEYELSIAWHYSYGSKHKTKFWNQIQERAKTFLNSYPKTQKEHIERSIYSDLINPQYQFFKLGFFVKDDYLQVNSGMQNMGDPYINHILYPNK